MTDPQTERLNRRLRKLRDLGDVLSEFESRLGDDGADAGREKVRRARQKLEQAGDHVDDQHFDRYFTQAAASAAGVAISRGYDDVAAKLFEATDLDPDESADE